MTPPNAERRPGGGQGGGLTGSGSGHGIADRSVKADSDIPPACPWIRAALALGDYQVMAAVLVHHPAELCPARRGRAA
jgi:hypothetical protein